MPRLTNPATLGVGISGSGTAGRSDTGDSTGTPGSNNRLGGASTGNEPAGSGSSSGSTTASDGTSEVNTASQASSSDIQSFEGAAGKRLPAFGTLAAALMLGQVMYLF